MSFFTDASLVMVPSGIKNQKVYSIKPTDGSGDLTFSRASNATRVNSSGLVEKVRTNEIPYSQDFDNVAWIKDKNGTGVVPVVTGNNATAPDGTLTADTIVFDAGAGTTTGDSSVVYQAITATGLCTASFYARVTSGTGQLVFRSVGGSTYTTANLTTTWQRFSAAETGSSGFFEIGIRRGLSNEPINASVTAELWAAQLETGDIATDYIATTSSAVSVGPVSGLPRLDYSGGASCGKLLLEPQRTNLVTYSEQFNNAYWSKTAGTTITANTTISPDGYQNADTIAFAGSGDSINLFTTTGLSVVSGTTYTYSVFTKSTTQVVFFGGATGGTGTNVYNGAIDYGNGWYRQSVTRTWSASGTVSVQLVLTLNAAGSTILYGFQAELGAYATSYIPTLSTAVTRVADSAYKTGISSLIGQTEGTIFIEAEYIDGVQDARFTLSDGGTNNMIFLSAPEPTGGLIKMRMYINAGGVNQVNKFSSTIVTKGTHKYALAYKANDVVMYLDGQNEGSDTSATIPACNQLTVTGGGPATPEALISTGIKQVILFPTRLTNAQLAELTA